MSESNSADPAAERADTAPAPQVRQALQAVQVSLDRRDNGGDGATMLEK